ncbi:hypothetical protein ES707_19044 [subsurface metagenome]
MLLALKNKPVAIIEQEVEDTIKTALRKFNMPNPELGSRSPGYGDLYPKEGQLGRADLRPDHVAKDATLAVAATDGLGGDKWSNTLAYTHGANATGWVTDLNITIDEDIYIILEGIFDISVNPLLSAIQFSVAGMDYPVINIRDMFSFDPKGAAWFPMPFVVPEKVSLKVYHRYIHDVATARTTTTVGSEMVGFIGEVIAKQAYLQKQVHR